MLSAPLCGRRVSKWDPDSTGRASWKILVETHKAVNFAISGDRTQHVLWRVQNGELDDLKPKAAVVMIGTNNLGGNTEDEIAEGVKAVVDEIRKKRPETKILLLGILPRGQAATDGSRERIKTINQSIAKLGGGMVTYLDIGAKFLEKDGAISKDVMPDFLHLSAKGYDIWADAIAKPLAELVKK